MVIRKFLVLTCAVLSVAYGSQMLSEMDMDLRELQRGGGRQGGGGGGRGGGGRDQGGEGQRGQGGSGPEERNGGREGSQDDRRESNRDSLKNEIKDAIPKRLKQEMKNQGKDCLPVVEKNVCDLDEIKQDFRCNRDKTEICLKNTQRLWWIIVIVITAVGCCAIGIVLALCLTDKMKAKKRPQENQVEATAVSRPEEQKQPGPANDSMYPMKQQDNTAVYGLPVGAEQPVIPPQTNDKGMGEPIQVLPPPPAHAPSGPSAQQEIL